MKLVKVRINKEIPERLATRLSRDNLTVNAFDACMRDVFAWAGEDPEDTDGDPELAAKVWNNVAVALALSLLPCFSGFKKKPGGRRKRDAQAGKDSPLSWSDAEWLVQVVEATVARRKKEGIRARIVDATEELKTTFKTNKVISPRSAGTLERLYFEERKRLRGRNKKLAELLMQPTPRKTGLFGLGELLLEQHKATETKGHKIK